MAEFFERFRAEAMKYAAGVHQLGPPAAADAVRGLPDELAAFYRSWNGAELFIDALRIVPAAEVERDGELWVFGTTAVADRLALDARGQVVRLEEDTGEALVEGTSFARWIEGYVSAEGALYDREGEFREGVFDDSGEELTPESAERRERRALKIDRGAPAPAWRLARALVRLGRADKAQVVLEELLARTPGFAWAWFDLGKLLREAGRIAEAEAAYARAAEVDPGYEHAGYFAAQAARAAVAREDAEARARHAARALELDPELPRAQREAAQRLIAEERGAEALEAAELVRALMPGDLQAMDLVRRARSMMGP